MINKYLVAALLAILTLTFLLVDVSLASIGPIGDSFDTATTLGFTGTGSETEQGIADYLTLSDCNHYFQFTPALKGIRTLRIKESYTEQFMSLYSSDYTELVSPGVEEGIDYKEHITYEFLAYHTYFIKISCGDTEGSYYLTWDYLSSGSSSAIYWQDDGVIEAYNDDRYEDWYYSNWAAGQDIQISLEGEDGSDFDLWVYSGDDLINSIAESLTPYYPETVRITTPTDETYIRVTRWDGEGEYQLSVVPAPPLIPTGVLASDGTYNDRVRVSWIVPTGATYYRVYRNTTNDSSLATQLISNQPASPYDDLTAEPGVHYFYWVIACNPTGCSDYSAPDEGYRAVSAPMPPMAVIATDGSYNDRVRVYWSTTDGATYFRVYRNTSNTTIGATTLTTSHTASPYDDFSAGPGVIYYYWVKACNSAGCSEYSEVDDGYRAIIAPLPPTDVYATNGIYTDRVRVSWIAPSDATFFQVYRNTSDTTIGATALTTDHSESPFDDFTADAGIIFYYWVIACNSAGCSDYSASDYGYRTILEPLPPTGITASDGTYTDRVRLSWTASDDATYYKVYRNTSNTTSGAVTLTANHPASPYDDYTVEIEIPYYYWVIACNSAGCSEYSPSDDGFRGNTAPIPPINIEATDGTYTDRVQVSWNASTGATYYQVFRNTTFDTSSAVIITPSHPASPFDDMTAAEWTLYYYWVKACNSVGCSDYSGGDFGWVSSAPSAPTDVSATDGDHVDRVSVSWTAPANANFFQVYRNITNTTSGATILTSNHPGSPYEDFSADAGVIYYYWLKACNEVDCSSYSSADTGYRGTVTNEFKIYLPITIRHEMPLPFCGILFTDDFSTDKGWINESNGTVYRDPLNNWLFWDARRSTPMHYYYPINADSDLIQLDLRFKVTNIYGNGLVWFGLTENLGIVYPNILGIDRPGIFFGPHSNTAINFFSVYSDHTYYDQSAVISYQGMNVWQRAILTIDQSTWSFKLRDENDLLIKQMSGVLPRQHSAYNYVMLMFNYGGGWETMAGLLDDVVVNGCTSP